MGKIVYESATVEPLFCSSASHHILNVCARREMKQKGVSIPRGSMQLTGIQTMEGGQLTDVTSDKASLTKHEYVTILAVGGWLSHPHISQILSVTTFMLLLTDYKAVNYH